MFKFIKKLRRKIGLFIAGKRKCQMCNEKYSIDFYSSLRHLVTKHEAHKINLNQDIIRSTVSHYRQATEIVLEGN